MGQPQYITEVIAVGDEIKVKVLSYDQTPQGIVRVQTAQEDPWRVAKRYDSNQRLHGKVVPHSYGAFEMEPGVEGLIQHRNDLESSWQKPI